MSILSILQGVDWLAAAEKATTNKESLLPLLFKTALDGAKVAGGDTASILTLLSDIEQDFPRLLALFETNNTQVAPTPGTAT